MTEELARFDVTMNELRAAYQAANGKPSVQASIKVNFDKVVVEKDRYLFGLLAEKAAALNALSALLEDAIAIIQAHIANFPLATLKRLFAGGEPGPVDVVTDPVIVDPVNDNGGGGSQGEGGQGGGQGGGGTDVPPAPGPVIVTGDMIRVAITPSDFDALCRVAQSEVGHFGKYGNAQLAGGLAAVVDTIINRTAHKGYSNSLQAVIDQPFQFSAINTIGTWKNLPAARTDVSTIIGEHLRFRATGGACTVKGATHFLNPYLSSANALATWGNFVVSNPVAVFGNDAKKDVHYHGFAPNTALPRPYVVNFGGQEAGFSGGGLAAGTEAGAESMASRILALCQAEWERFDKGGKKEAEDPQFRRIGDYWAAINLPHNGRTQILNQATGRTYNPPWSAAFISYVLKQAGAGSGFRYAQAHCHYVQDFISGRANAVYEAMHPDHYAPAPGDMVHFGRSGAKRFDFTEARVRYDADSFYSSHSDIVTEVDSGAGLIRTIGGNVSNSVSQKRFKIKADGKLEPRTEGGETYPWIAILRLIK